MNPTKFRAIFINVLLLIGLVFVFAFIKQPDPLAADDNVFTLQPPALMNVANSPSFTGTQSIADEAGISAYFQAPNTINLADVRSLYRTIEDDTGSYIIGSIPVPDYSEWHDVHVYIHVDGWVLAYYPNDIPVAKIFDWRGYDGATIASTKLENVLGLIATEIGLGSGFVANYYDFRYPNATNMLLVAETRYNTGTDPFEIKLPGTYTYYERSWGLGVNYFGRYFLNGAEISELSGTWSTSEGILTAAQLPADSVHTIGVYAGSQDVSSGGLAIIYKETP